MQENYQFKEGWLIIQDALLGITIDTPFLPKLIPNDFKDRDLVIEKDREGMIRVAYFESGGQSLVYYPDGTIERECYYLDKKLHGPSYFYSASGVLLSESWFYLGKKEGKMTRSYLSGKLSAIERYRQGVRHGKQEYYYEDGGIKTLMIYKEGRLDGKALLYGPNGEEKHVAN